MPDNKAPELLAPAGNAAMLHAAVTAGADAVYLGMGEFNARRNADNFTEESFAEACSYAHLRGRRIYVTMNTIVLPGEMDAALRCAKGCWRAGADAFIVQDLGLALALAKEIPGVRLHASTQMNIHGADGLQACALLGFSRVTLARELSIDEIGCLCSVAGSLGMEVETFVHGALCVCYSGQCLMSSMIGGRSANRGLCAQPCRLPYMLRDARDPSRDLKAPGEFILSPKDLCSIDNLGPLVSAGVSSLKIEGRMKSPEYVGAVTSVYREALDAIACEEATSPAEKESWRTRLGQVFSRGFSTAYQDGNRGNDAMSYQRPNNRGQLVGRVKAVRDGEIVLACDKALAKGDLLEAWTRRGNIRIPVDAEPSREGKKGAVVATDEASIVREGDRVFRIRSAEAAFHDDDKEPRIPVKGRVRLEPGEPLRVGFETADGAFSASAEGPIVENARTKAVCTDEVRAHIDRLGQTPFFLESLDVELGDNVGIGFSVLHHARTEALCKLEEAILSARAPRDEAARPSTALDISLASNPDEPACEQSASICVVATNPECARAARRNGADAIYVPALNYRRGQSQTAGALDADLAQAGFPKHSVLMVPSVVHDKAGSSREAALGFDAWANVQEGSVVYADSIGAILHAAECGCTVEVGASVPVTNRSSLDVVSALGATKVWLSPELNLQQISDLVSSRKAQGMSFGVKVAGAQELMVTEHCALMSTGECTQECGTCPRRRVPHVLEDRKGYMFPIQTDALGRTHIYNSVELDNAPAIPDLLLAGVTSFMLDSTLMTPEQTAQATGRLAKALKLAVSGCAAEKARGTTTGHLFRGVK